MIENGHGRRAAILIGTNEYLKIDKLEFAENDAREMGKVLSDKNICGFDEVIVLINKSLKEVSTTIEGVFKDAKKEDQVLIYYSGHGKPSSKFDLCLLFKDTDPDRLLSTSLKYDFINDCKDESACNRVVVILDCCYSGVADVRGDFLQETLKKYSGSGTILLTSTGQEGSSIAKEDRELKHGVFTHYLIKGLKDWAADYNEDGIITVDDLYKYSYDGTKDKGLQRPQKTGSSQGEMVIGKNLQKLKDKDFEQKKHKLMNSLSSAPSFVIQCSFKTLQKIYKNPSDLEPLELKIKPHLESLLSDEIQAETYIEIVKSQEELRKQREQEERKKKQKEEQEKKQKEEAKIAEESKINVKKEEAKQAPSHSSHDLFSEILKSSSKEKLFIIGISFLVFIVIFAYRDFSPQTIIAIISGITTISASIITILNNGKK